MFYQENTVYLITKYGGETIIAVRDEIYSCVFEIPVTFPVVGMYSQFFKIYSQIINFLYNKLSPTVCCTSDRKTSV